MNLKYSRQSCIQLNNPIFQISQELLGNGIFYEKIRGMLLYSKVPRFISTRVDLFRMTVFLLNIIYASKLILTMASIYFDVHYSVTLRVLYLRSILIREKVLTSLNSSESMSNFLDIKTNDAIPVKTNYIFL